MIKTIGILSLIIIITAITTYAFCDGKCGIYVSEEDK